MKFFLDTEFIERGPNHPVELVSVAIVSELGAEFYAVSSEFDPSHANEWIKQNVLSCLGDAPRLSHKELAPAILGFIENSGFKNPDGTISRFKGKPEFWGYYADYARFSEL